MNMQSTGVSQQAHQGVNTCTHQHIVGGGVPAQDADTFGVTIQLDYRICERRGQPAIWDLPDLFSKETIQ